MPTDPPPQIVGKDRAPIVLIPASEFGMGTDPADVYDLVRWARGFYSKVEANWFGMASPPSFWNSVLHFYRLLHLI